MNTSPHAARLSAWHARWSGLAPRERQALALGATCIGLATVWWVLLAPALQTLRQAPAQHAALDQRLQRMQHLQAEAQRLQADLPPPRAAAPGTLPPPPEPDLRRSLQESVNAQLGASAQLVLQGERAQLTLKSVPAPALAAWLGQVRQNLKVAPIEMRLTLDRPEAHAPDLRWDGSLVLALPGATP